MLSVPASLIDELNARTIDGTPPQWPQVLDKDGDRWDITDVEYEGEPVLMPWASGLWPAKRSSVESFYGPLTAARANEK